ncbi:SfnB family sulfur acquisition oxidoreductase [Comamonas sp.]|uniref:SfnB family sulfur acquisition oxidoreductase n=1 Tax=Comamonas sp. TaxID=34028 RepID=UPI00289CC326|nr:SfnB family sulfur acquisition oxidoreductase [Comamonas sp.]
MTSAVAQGAALPADSPSRLPLPPSQPALIRSEAEALQVAAALAESFRGGAARRDSERLLPWDEIERYTASGLGGITVPRSHGGLQASWHTVVQVFASISAADASLGQIPQNHFALVQNLRDTASPEQQSRWFADVLSGHRLGNAGPERKGRAAQLSDATASLRQTADGRLLVNGTRYYSTGSLFAHWVPFRAEDEAQRPVQVWVRRTAPGLQIIDNWNAFGQKTTASGGVVLKDIEVEPRDVIALHDLKDRPTLSGPVSQILQAAIDMGIAQGAFDEARQFVRDKTRAWVHSGVEHAWQDPYIIQEFGQLQVELDAAREVLLDAAKQLDALAAQPVTDESSAQASVAVARAKILTTEAALNASERLLELGGTSSARAGYNLDRYWRNARVHTLHDPVRWKYHLLGNYLLNGRAPRRHQWN